MTENDIIQFVSGFPGVVTQTIEENSDTPEVAWGDTFFFYDPEGTLEAHPRQPFATIVIKDYPDWDTVSDLNRPGVFRLNIAIGRAAMERLVGDDPDVDYTAEDRVVPHPKYATQGWIAIVSPGEQARPLLTEAHARAVARHRPRKAS
ncbi:DUF6194 family protein [Nonomuraea sp. NPDC005650]|uniref:DUF6194 family protein n=1 Tax=Nonomuraea sp. NPDC005650 TaxID=3157045 RepID=UPI00339EF157